MKYRHNILGKNVLPIAKRCQWGISEVDTSGQYHYLQGEARAAHVKRVMDAHMRHIRAQNKLKKWEVFSIHADGTFTLRSEDGYEQAYVNRCDFRLLKTTQQ